MQFFFVLGGFIATVGFYLIVDWRIVWILLVLLPSVLGIMLVFCYIQ